MNTRLAVGVMAAMTLLWLPLLAHSQAASPREQLREYMADLQKNPTDDALREKIIKLAQELKPPPGIPEEARRHYVRADALRGDATSPQDASAAAAEYEQALLEAPWWPEAYRDLGVALEVATRYVEAKKALNLYLLCHPSEDEARKTQDEIYRIEAKEGKLAQELHRQTATLVGSWAFLCRVCPPSDSDCSWPCARFGDSICSNAAEFTVGMGADRQYTVLWHDPSDTVDQVRITPASVRFRMLQDTHAVYAFYFDFKLSEDGKLVGTKRYFFKGHEDHLLIPDVIYCRK